MDPDSLLAPQPDPEGSESNPDSEETLTSSSQEVLWVNHPRCKACSQPLRPAILMFNDLGWLSDKRQGRRFANWESSLRTLLKEAWKGVEVEKESKESLAALPKLTIVEVGCGKNVPTVRMHNEMLFETLPAGSTSFIRINLDFCKVACSNPKAMRPYVVEIRETGLAAVTKIQSHLEPVKKEEEKEKEDKK